jgi:hypothetical protein
VDRRYINRPRGRADWHRITAVLVLIILVLAVVAFSPLFMLWIAGRAVDWARLSDVGQAHGGVSAVISGLAFAGIAVSLLLQWRQTRTSQIVAARERHFELLRLSLERPELSPVGRGQVDEATFTRRIISNMFVAHWGMLWDLDLIEELALRRDFAELFKEEVARQWWADLGFGAEWGDRSSGHRRAFLRIANSEYDLALRVSVPRQERSGDGSELVDAGHDESIAG